MFPKFRTRFMKVWRPSTAILYSGEASGVFSARWHALALSKVHMHGQCLHTHTRICSRKKPHRFGFLFLFGLWFLHQGFSHDSYDLEDYSRHTQTQSFKHQ